MVQNLSATKSGLSTVPLMVSLIVASTGGGIFIAKTGAYTNLTGTVVFVVILTHFLLVEGKYSMFPVIGCSILAFGTGLLGLLNSHFNYGSKVTRAILCSLACSLCRLHRRFAEPSPLTVFVINDWLLCFQCLCCCKASESEWSCLRSRSSHRTGSLSECSFGL